MCYYDSWFEENWCEEPREEEMALIEAIKENVKQYIKQEMERLRKEQKTQTNADKIRSMTDEELYDFCALLPADTPIYHLHVRLEQSCFMLWDGSNSQRRRINYGVKKIY